MRIALGIEYDGHGYYGWQQQQNLQTIQGELQAALAEIAAEPIFLHCAGRTDANVHATGQVVHFDTRAKRHIDAWIWGTNSKLPSAIVVRWAKGVDYSFHARFSANSRRYRYIIFNHPIRPAILNGKVTWYYYPLDVPSMHTAAQFLLGEQDFSSFRSADCNSSTPMRCITEISVQRKEDFVVLEVEANAFLHHMVRNIVGALLKVGSGHREIGFIKEALMARSRQAAAETAAADGLYLIKVKYPEKYGLPDMKDNFIF